MEFGSALTTELQGLEPPLGLSWALALPVVARESDTPELYLETPEFFVAVSMSGFCLCLSSMTCWLFKLGTSGFDEHLQGSRWDDGMVGRPECAGWRAGEHQQQTEERSRSIVKYCIPTIGNSS